ncbi:DNA-binding protein [Streptomyces sp. 7N604]|uniref:DNA-binding protein n=1 Tax=Streptomyces sp. 7N604 TaxID=3457415 RepID=UPI003FD37A76
MTTALVERKWYTTAEVAKMLVLSGEIRSVKDGRNRRIRPRWVDEYVERRAREVEQGWSA